MTRKDIAIIGGTFDPVHNAHIMMAKYLSDNYIVDEVWMLPSYNSPHKNIDTIKSYDDRVNMLKLATIGIKNVKVSTFEKEYFENTNSNAKTYTKDILDAMIKKYLNTYIHFVVGFDSIKHIHTWHDYQGLLKRYFFYVFDRKDDEFKTKEQKKLYIDNLGKKISMNRVSELLDAEIPDISSTELRILLKDKLMNKDKILTMIPKEVYNYIILHDLYN